MITAHQMFQMLMVEFFDLFIITYMVQNAAFVVAILKRLLILRPAMNIRHSGKNIGRNTAVKH
jgi:hypothetical protein